MLLGPGETAASADSSCTVHLEEAHVHMVVRGLSSCERFLSDTSQRCLDKCFESLVNRARTILLSTDYDLSVSEAQFATEGMNNVDF